GQARGSGGQAIGDMWIPDDARANGGSFVAGAEEEGLFAGMPFEDPRRDVGFAVNGEGKATAGGFSDQPATPVVIGVDDGEAAGFQVAEEALGNLFASARRVIAGGRAMKVCQNRGVELDAAGTALGERFTGEFEHGRLAFGQVHPREPGGELW